ncbi:MAG: hypothetical protein LBB34_04650 [Holosporales bacterium]|jgi:hypothetical protein|nr:hypothetical protein [Holosporales bacterium]
MFNKDASLEDAKRILDKELEVAKFRVPLQSRAAFSSFTSQILGNYRLEKFAEGLKFQITRTRQLKLLPCSLRRTVT